MKPAPGCTILFKDEFNPVAKMGCAKKRFLVYISCHSERSEESLTMKPGLRMRGTLRCTQSDRIAGPICEYHHK